MRKSKYLSCNCSACRAVSSKRNSEAKKAAHRRLRRAEKEALRQGEDGVESVGCEYRG